MKKTAYPVPLSLIALSIMAANPVFSADTLEVEHQLDTVTIEADALSENVPKVGSSASSIDYKNIEKTLVRNLDDLVRYEPGVDASQDSRFGISSINIRGLDGEW